MRKSNAAEGMIYKSMKKHRTRFLVTEIFLIALLLLYFIMCYEYISNVFMGAAAFDEAKFASETETIAVGEPFELHRSDNVSISDYALRPDSYWQENKYEFDVKLENAQKLPVSFTNATTDTGDDSESDEISTNLYIAQINGIKTLVLCYPHQDIASTDTVTGIFTSIPLVVAHDVAGCGAFASDDEICSYMLDTRGIEMESETFDVVFCLILLLVIIFLGIKLIIQYTDFHRTPTYSQLAKYGEIQEIEEQVEGELTLGVRKKKKTVTENWIVSEDTFKLKIVKNHLKHGSFNYTPKV